jgi:opacity protein-like surface antigen
MNIRPSATILVALTLVCAILAPANAADLGGPTGRQRLEQRNSDAAPFSMLGFYFGSRNGIAFADDTNFDVGGGAVRVTNQYETGMMNAFMLGYNFGAIADGVGFRADLEFGRTRASIDTHTVNGGRIGSIDSFGDVTAYTGFASGFLDFNLGRMSSAAPDSYMHRVTPYIGGGVGFSQVELGKQGISATGVIMDNDDTKFAFHVSAGVGIEVYDRTTLELGYRYMSVPDLEFVARDGTKTNTDFNTSIITLGIRRQF